MPKGKDIIVYVVCDTAKVRFFKQITTSTSTSNIINGCLRYCKSTIFQANHNNIICIVCIIQLFAILQKYDFSSKSQRPVMLLRQVARCLRYCKSTIFQANHNNSKNLSYNDVLFAILQKYDFSSKSQLINLHLYPIGRCLRYCKSTIFQANHNWTNCWP